jgi:hypothetical protein
MADMVIHTGIPGQIGGLEGRERRKRENIRTNKSYATYTIPRTAL